MSFRLLLAVFVVIGGAFGAGWLVGAGGKSALEMERNRIQMQAEFTESRAFVLDGRVSLYRSHFGDAIERFQKARTDIGRVQARLRELGQPDQAGKLEIAVSHLSDAQHLAGLLDARAGDAADSALEALDNAGRGV